MGRGGTSKRGQWGKHGANVQFVPRRDGEIFVDYAWKTMLGFFFWNRGMERAASKTNTAQKVWTCRKVKQNTNLCWIRHHHTKVFPRTRPMRTGSGPLYSSITKNWFQSQLLRWRERGPPSSDSVTHFVLCRVLWSRMPLTPVSKWRSGRLAYSSELGAILRALITPSTSSLVKVLLFLRFRVSSRLCSANRDLAAMSALKPKLFGFLSVLGRVLASPLTFWCGISESFKFDSKWGKSRCGRLHGICGSRSSFNRPAATTGTCRSMKRTSRTKRAAIAAMTRSLCFKGKSLLGWWGSAAHGGPSRLEPSPPPSGPGLHSSSFCHASSCWSDHLREVKEKVILTATGTLSLLYTYFTNDWWIWQKTGYKTEFALCQMVLTFFSCWFDGKCES